MVTVRGVTTSTCAPHLRPASCVPPGQARRSDDSCDSAVDGPTAGLILLLARRTRPAASRSTASRGGRFPGTNRADDGDGQPPRQSAMTKDTVDRHPRGKDRTRTAVALGGGRLANSAAKGVVMPVEKLPGGTHGTRTPPSMLGRIMTPLMVRFHRRAGDRFQGMDLLYLTTVGARPGRPRSPGLTTAREAGSSWRPREAPHNNRAGTTTSPPTRMRSGWRYPEKSTVSRSTSSRESHVRRPGLRWWNGYPGSRDISPRPTASSRCFT